MLITGSCHCGNLSFTLDWQPEPTEIPARACGCSFCVKHGGVWTSCPTGSLRVRARLPERVARYEFGTKTAQFHVCTECGIVPVVTSLIADRLYAVVSVNAFDNVDADAQAQLGFVRRQAMASSCRPRIALRRWRSIEAGARYA